ncbi:TniQ family protein [Mycobacterium sp. 48b]|uniref:TniQ family protein n=1 Tax=Mycobacterium sp. 48b TaxID=3400426 RepID=UPI003AAF1A40
MTLPMRVKPIPGESLVSWLAAHATRMKCWWGEVLQIVLPRYSYLGTYARDLRLVAHLSDDQRDAIANATHTDPADVAAMTLAGRYEPSLISIDPVSGRPDTPWGKISRQRFCPLCLKTDPGRDRLDWLLPWITTCPEHQCYLADACTRDGHHQCVSPTWLHLLAPPLTFRCRGIVHAPSNSAVGARCTARLSNAPLTKLRGNDPVLLAQQTLSEWLSRPQIDRGLYSAAPARPDELLQDVLQLSARLLNGIGGTDLLSLWEHRATEHRITYWDETLRVRQAGQDNGVKSARVAAAPAAVVSAWVTTAMQILTKPSITEAADALRAAKHMMENPAPERMPPVCARYSTALAAAEILSRKRCLDVFAEVAEANDVAGVQHPQNDRVHDHDDDTTLRAIRAGLWAPWTLGLDTGTLSWTMHCQTLTRLLLAMASPLAGPEANRRLHIHPKANSAIGRAARQLYSHRQWAAIHEALKRLSRYLRATPPPIDYQRRRDLDYRRLLNDRQWSQVA